MPFLISYDIEDLNVDHSVTRARLNSFPNLYYYFSETTSKVAAINRDISKHLDFDILVVAHDQMTLIADGYDAIIAEAMNTHFPDFDGVLNFNNSKTGAQLNACPIIGKNYYQRFNYVYYPAYHSSSYDFEFSSTTKMLQKEACIKRTIMSSAAPLSRDCDSNDLYFNADRDLLYTRKANNFDLHHTFINPERLPTTLDLYNNPLQEIIWSILICTVDERSHLFPMLYKKLIAQIEREHLQDKIEIIFYKDNKEKSIGFKRNQLVANAKGKYIAFIDDDDDVSSNYIPLIYDCLLKDPDCVNLVGVMTINGQLSYKLYHTNALHDYSKDRYTYYRPPTHLNPIRKKIAEQFTFPDLSKGEDNRWAMALSRSGLLVKEEKVSSPYYFYKFNAQTSLSL